MSRLSNMMKRYGIEDSEVLDIPVDGEADVVVPTEGDVVVEPAVVDEADVHAEIEEATETAEQLDQLADYTEAAPEEVSVEQYHFMFSTIMKNAKLKMPKALGLESFTNSDSGKLILARSIRAQSARIKERVSYVKGVLAARK